MVREGAILIECNIMKSNYNYKKHNEWKGVMKLLKNIAIFMGISLFLFSNDLVLAYKKSIPLEVSNEYAQIVNEYKNKRGGLADLDGNYNYSGTFKGSNVYADFSFKKNQLIYELSLNKDGKKIHMSTRANYRIKGRAIVFEKIEGDRSLLPVIGIPFKVLGNKDLQIQIGDNPSIVIRNTYSEMVNS